MSRPKPARLAAYYVAEPGREPESIALWCPYCEEVHRHGAAAGGHRGAHCIRDRASPLICTGYALDIVGTIASEAELRPDALFAGKRRLHEAIAGVAGKVRAALMQALSGVPLGRDGAVCRQFGRTWLYIGTDLDWQIEREARPVLSGKGFLSLGNALFGVAEKIVALRLFEAATGIRLDAEGVDDFLRLIGDWRARGAPSRETLR